MYMHFNRIEYTFKNIHVYKIPLYLPFNRYHIFIYFFAFFPTIVFIHIIKKKKHNMFANPHTIQKNRFPDYRLFNSVQQARRVVVA